jgi:hypothetical protein
LVHHRRGSLRQAIQYYELYLSRSADAADAGTVRQYLETAAKSLASLN